MRPLAADVMAYDYLGNPVSSVHPAAVAAVDDFVGGFLMYQPRIDAVAHAAKDFPRDALVNVYAGFLHMLAEDPQAAANARRFLYAAETSPGATERERALAAHLRAWIENDMPRALEISRAIVAAHPRDLATVKLHQYHAFNLGDFPEMLRIAEAALPAAADVAQMHGMHAFALEQCHLLDDAEAAARRALALYPDEPWAHHALAHVMLTEGRIAEGARFLEQAAPSWEALNSFMHTHNWWHLALFYLSQDRGGDALAAYDRHVWGKEKAYSQDQVGAVSLLARLEFAGVDVGVRWVEVAGYLAGRAADTVQPFLSLQYLYGLARAGRPEASALMDAIRAQAASAPEFAREAWAEVALPAAEGIVAFLADDAPAAARKLGQALPRMVEIGGSHAQRDLFEQIYLEALLAAERWSLAQQLLEARRAHDPDGAPLNRKLARAYRALDLPRQAAQAQTRADRAHIAETA
ncbi:MAG: tetratricopeptide repeat protein [Phenylobacterium sp.]